METILDILWRLNLVHVPAWDCVPSPFKVVEPKPQQETQERKERLPKPDAAPNGKIKTYQVGETKINQPREFASYVENEVKVQDATVEGEWEFMRYDGKEGARYDFTEWSAHDDDVIAEKGWTTARRRDNYVKVRPLVLEDRTNKYIAEHFGMKIGWAEMYAGACRESVRRQLSELRSTPSPD